MLALLTLMNVTARAHLDNNSSESIASSVTVGTVNRRLVNFTDPNASDSSWSAAAMDNLRNITESLLSASTTEFGIMEHGFNALIRKEANVQGRIKLPLNDVVDRGDVIHEYDLCSLSCSPLYRSSTRKRCKGAVSNQTSS
jgi:hypothetical protein